MTEAGATEEPALVGRDREIASLLAALAAARNGSPRVVVIDAEAGLGKSALLRGFTRRVRGPLVHLTCDPFERVIDYSLVELLTAQRKPPVSPVAAGRALLNWVNGLQPAAATAAVVVVDDVQWMDPSSVEALRFALRRLSADRVLVVLARRPPAGRDPWHGLLADTRRTSLIRLEPLISSDVASLGRQLRGWELDPVAADRLTEHTGGIPLLLRTYLDAAEEDDVTATSARVPLTTRAAVVDLLGPLDADSTLLADALAVMDERTDRLLLGAVPGMGEPGHALTDLLATRIVRLDTGTDTVQFTHALLRDAVYDRMEFGRRQGLHRWASSQTAGDRSLMHRVAAAVGPDVELCAALQTAASRARAGGQPALAASHRLQARRVTGDRSVRDALLFEAVHDFLAADDASAAQRLREEVAAALPRPERALVLGTLAHRDGQVAEAQRWLDEVLADNSVGPEVSARAGAELGGMHAALNQGDLVLAAANHVQRGLPPDAEESAPGPLARYRTLQAIGLWETGQVGEALSRLTDYIPTNSPGDAAPDWEPDLFASRGMIRHWAGDLAGAVDDLGYAISLIGSWGPSQMRDRAHVQRSLSRFMLGDWDAAAVDASTACALAHSADRPWMIPLAHAAAVYVPAHRGDFAAATDHLEQARTGHVRVPSPQGASLVAGAGATLAAEQGNFDRVPAILESLMRGGALDRVRVVGSYRWAFVLLIRARLELGELESAERLLVEYRDHLTRLPHGAASARLGWLSGQLAQARGDLDSADRYFSEEAADPVLDSTPLGRAELLISHGVLLRTMGRRRDAIERLLQARSILTRLRAQPRLAQLDVELAACGLQGSASAPTGREQSLTERERDVAALVAKGLTNNEIAAELFLTAKTVEYHLRNIFTKLGLSRRQELRRLLTGAPLLRQ